MSSPNDKILKTLKFLALENPVGHRIPVNKTNWVKLSPTLWILTINDKTYSVCSSSTWKNLDENAPYNLFTETDGEKGRWISEKNIGNNWISLHFHKPKKCNYLKMKARAGDLTQAPTKFNIRGSNELDFIDSRYGMLGSFEASDFSESIIQEFKFQNERKFKYYSVIFDGATRGGCIGLAELNIGFQVTSEFVESMINGKTSND